MSAMILGLAGLRRVGKSHFADRLVERHGFIKIHPFNGGKAAVRAYYTHLGIDPETAWEMTDGSLKDTPCDRLPGGVASRFFMESFGRFMGIDMGPEWTIGQEIRLAREKAIGERLLVESLVYEDMVIRAGGGHICRILRPGVDPTPGLKTDEYTMRMIVDEEFINDKETLDDYYRDIDAYIEEILPVLSARAAQFEQKQASHMPELVV